MSARKASLEEPWYKVKNQRIQKGNTHHKAA